MSGGVGGTPATPDVVERAAQAIWRVDEAGAVGPFDELARGDRENYRSMAVAALGAVTEQPTPPQDFTAERAQLYRHHTCYTAQFCDRVISELESKRSL